MRIYSNLSTVQGILITLAGILMFFWFYDFLEELAIIGVITVFVGIIQIYKASIL